MRLGKHLGVGREILPPMPIPAYKNFNDADLEMIFAYLQSIPAVKNKVPAPLPPAAATPAKKRSAAAVRSVAEPLVDDVEERLAALEAADVLEQQRLVALRTSAASGPTSAR